MFTIHLAFSAAWFRWRWEWFKIMASRYLAGSSAVSVGKSPVPLRAQEPTDFQKGADELMAGGGGINKLAQEAVSWKHPKLRNAQISGSQ